MNKTAVVIVVLALASSAYGMVFSWTDSAGIKHFSNKREEIPERYRAKAKPLYPEPTDSLPVQQNAQSQPVKPDVTSAVQQVRPVEPPKNQLPIVAPGAPPKEVNPVAGRKRRRSSARTEEE
jgi:hypothetical protein